MSQPAVTTPAKPAKKSDFFEQIEGRVTELQNSGMIHFPPNYSPQNALQSAWLILQGTTDKDKQSVMETCTRESIYNALMYTVAQGLSPAKKQIYYIAYGNQLTAMRSYFGTMAVTKRMSGVQDVFAQVVYEGDEFEFEITRGTKQVTKHVTKLENINGQKIIAAYATIYLENDRQYTEIMNKAQIDMAWSRRSNKGQVQQDFPEEMAKRTVINRACKMFVNTSDDSDLLIEAFHATSGYDREEAIEVDITQNANQQPIDITDEAIISDAQELASGSNVQKAQDSTTPDSSNAAQTSLTGPGF